MAQSSDMSIFLTRDHDKFRATVENCSYLPRNEVQFSITSNGIEYVKNKQSVESSDQDQIRDNHIDKINDLLW